MDISWCWPNYLEDGLVMEDAEEEGDIGRIPIITHVNHVIKIIAQIVFIKLRKLLLSKRLMLMKIQMNSR